MQEYLTWHCEHFPLMEAQDVVKLIFQSMCGCGHLLASEDLVASRICLEEESLLPDPTEPLTEPLGVHVRLNLRRAMAEGIPPEWIARLMILSAKQTSVCTDRMTVYNQIIQLNDDIFPVPKDAIRHAAQRLLDEPNWLPSHTQAYHQAYQPAYRVIAASLTPLLKVLCELVRLREKERLLVCIDGSCGSGKTTFARTLAEIVDAAVIPMDDFFTPHAQKTPDRLAQPAGNADITRFCDEVMSCYLAKQEIIYRPYICWQDTFGECIHVSPKRITIIEGSYSLHPQIGGNADVRVWLTVHPSVQRERLLQRDGEAMLQRFENLWIPLEKSYASAFGLPDSSCLVLDTLV